MNENLNKPGWLADVFKTVCCANCGSAYGEEGVNVVGNRNEYWFLRCLCPACSTQGLGVVIVQTHTPAQLEAAHYGSLPAINSEDVLAVHDALTDYNGDVSGLFAQPRS